MRLAVHVLPHDVLLLHVADSKSICAVSCAGGHRNQPQISALPRQRAAEMQRSAGAAPGREGCSRAKSHGSMRWYHPELLAARNRASCVPCAPAGIKEKQSNVLILLAPSA